MSTSSPSTISQLQVQDGFVKRIFPAATAAAAGVAAFCEEFGSYRFSVVSLLFFLLHLLFFPGAKSRLLACNSSWIRGQSGQVRSGRLEVLLGDGANELSGLLLRSEQAEN